MQDEAGRYELGFPYRAWPSWQAIEEVFPASKDDRARMAELVEGLKKTVDLRFATDEETARCVESFNGAFPIYRSVYRFRTIIVEDGVVKPDRNSAIVDKLFFEFEHHACGRLCEHTMLDVSKFINWLRRNNIEPWVLYSGGKSLHVYLMFDEVKLRHPHEAIKRVLKIIAKKARLMFVDFKAMLGTAQMARVMNAMNPKTRRYAIPLRADEVLQMGPARVVALSDKPRIPAWRPIRNNKFCSLLTEVDDQIAAQELMDELFPPTPKVDAANGEMCGNVKATWEVEPTHDIRGHKGLFALLIYCKQAGMSHQEGLGFVTEWNEKSQSPMSKGYLRYQAEWVYKNKVDDYSPCMVVAPFMGGCPLCMSKEG